MPGFGKGKFGGSFGGSVQPPVAEVLTIGEELAFGEDLALQPASKTFTRAGFGRGRFGSGNFGSGDQPGVLEGLSVSEALTLIEGVAVAEIVSISEDLDVREGLRLAESLTLGEFLSTGALEISNVGGNLVRVTFPVELHYDGIAVGNFHIDPTLGGGAQGVPVAVNGLKPVVTVLQGGSDGAVIPEMTGQGVNDLADGLSTWFRLTGALDPLANVGDFLTISNGQNAGHYQIIEVVEPGGPESIVRVDRPMVLVDGTSGVWSLQAATSLSNLDDPVVVPVDLQLIEIDGDEYTFRAKHPAIAPSNSIQAVYRVGRLARAGSDAPSLNGGGPEGALVAEETFSLEDVTILDYRTFRLNDNEAPGLRGASLSSIVDRFAIVVQLTSAVEWAHTTGVHTVDIATSKLTDSAAYLVTAKNLRQKWPKVPVALEGTLGAQGVPRPRVVTTDISPEGHVIVTFDESMQQDPGNLMSPSDYSISGPGAVGVKRVFAVDERTVALVTSGLGDGSYELVVSTNTPKDIAGNPIDPAFNTAVFDATAPLSTRSVFTDRGPIVKPPLMLQSGAGGLFESSQRVVLSGATLTSSAIGRRLRLMGSAGNDGAYEILAVLGPTLVRVRANFALPDANSGAVGWEVFDPRTGQVADDPSDVVVRVDGDLVTPVAVVGLRGQIVLPSPVPIGEIAVDYSWFSNPRVEVRRLNSLEFRLNAWNRDPGGHTPSNHHYRYNNVLVNPSLYEPEDIAAAQEQPLLRDVKYRAYERAYTAILNDPTRLLFNTPIHRIAFPAASRTLSETAVLYDAVTLPENDPERPWMRKGLGNAVAAAGSLVVIDDSAATFPLGLPLFWTQSIDVSFEHVFSVAWRFSIESVVVSDGVWTGIAAGYSDTRVVRAVGYIEEGGVKKIGFLKRGAGDDLGLQGAWVGGLNSSGDPTDAPVPFDWGVLHSYRMFTDRSGVTRLFVDGDVVETLRLTPEETPFLEELNGPFDEIQGVFFGSLSRPTQSTSTWEFYQYLIQPLSTLQIGASSFVAYEGEDLPELDPSPWTLVGFHGTSTVLGSGTLLLDSTSATDTATSASAGLVGGDFRGYVKIEPLLAAASQVAVDAQVELLTNTHGVDPDGLMLAVDDGARLLQLSFLSSEDAPKLSYGGRSLPTEFSPFVWSTIGAQPVEMKGRVLRIEDTATLDGRVYSIEDTSPIGSASRVVSGAADYILETRLGVVWSTADPAGFAGAFAQVYDGTRIVGVMLQLIAGTPYVALHSDGVPLGPSARFAFGWNDGQAHTYRLRKSTVGNLVSVFADGTFLGSAAYGAFAVPPPSPPPTTVGQVSFGSSTPASAEATSGVDWYYCNAWRVATSPRRYAGLWKGRDRDSLLGYHLPLKAFGAAAPVIGNTLEDPLADYVTADVQPGDALIVDSGPNTGVYQVAARVSATVLTMTVVWPVQPSVVPYRIASETDWSEPHKYRLTRDSTGTVSVYLDATGAPLLSIDYDSVDLPASGAGVVHTLSGGLPAIAFGSFSPEHLEQSRWDFVRYGITRNVAGLTAVPMHQVMNQWNVMESPERLTTSEPLLLTNFKSSSTGTTPQTDPDFLTRGDVLAHTRVNEGTPIVPSTQTFENRGPDITQTPIASISDLDEVLNEPGTFTVSDGETRYTFTVPEDVLYTSMQLVETIVGEAGLLAPLGDAPNPSYGGVNYQGEACLRYEGDALPQDTVSPTPWAINSDDPDEVEVSVSSGVLTYGTGGAGTRTVYLNNTPLPDAPSLRTEATFDIRLVEDATLGTGDSQVRFGLSAPGMTVGVGFVTHPNGERFVEVYDLKSGDVMGRATVDYLDGDFHRYRIVRDPSAGMVEVYIDVS